MATRAHRRIAALFALCLGCGGAAGKSPAAPSAASSSSSISTTPNAGAQAPIDQTTDEAFTRSVLARFQTAIPKAKFAYVEPLVLSALGPRSDAPAKVSVDRLRHECKERPADCDAIVGDYVAKAAAILTHEDAPATRDAVVASVRNRAVLDNFPPDVAKTMLTEPLVGDLIVLYMVDSAQAARSLDSKDLAALKLDRTEAAKLARKNMGARLGSVVADLEMKPGEVSIIHTGEFYETSRLLQSDQWSALAARVKKPIVVAVPASDVIVVAAGVDADMRARLHVGVDRIFAENERPVSKGLYRWSGTGWVEER
jgi:uncharacterized protein YtpQ (UPF0354 family)